jgi:hypothetical protein
VEIRTGTLADAESIASLINKAFIVERVAFDGDRTSPERSPSFLAPDCSYWQSQHPRSLVAYIWSRANRADTSAYYLLIQFVKARD